MTTITDELRLAIREFKSRINSFNFVIDHEEPPFPINSLESHEAQLKLANEYLKEFPQLNCEKFNIIGYPLYVQNYMTHKIELHQLVEKSQLHSSVEGLLWEAYLTLDHGDHDERLSTLNKLESYFKRTGKPATLS